jgi:hypothetical protein
MTILKTQAELKETRHVEGVHFQCGQCGLVKPVGTSAGTGYGYRRYDDPSQSPICYDCCGENEAREMEETGRATLYLTCEPLRRNQERKTAGTVSNWPGTLKIPCHTRAGRHNIAGTRYDCWFTFKGKEWHGVQYGDNTQIVHCKRLNSK